MRGAGGWALLACAACGGGDEGGHGVDWSSSSAGDAGTIADAAVARMDARIGPTMVPGSSGDAAREPQPDAATHAACDPLRQTGCEAGAQCDRTEAGFACVPAGALHPFQRCAAADAAGLCRPGSTCLATSFGDARCAAYCDLATGSGCPGSGQTCAPLPGSRGALGACTTTHQCSPLEQDCDDPAESCAWTPLGTFCTQSGPFTQGTPCDSAASCEAGSTCVADGDGTTRCSVQCDPSPEGGGCASNEECVLFTDVGARPLGACRLRASPSPP